MKPGKIRSCRFLLAILPGVDPAQKPAVTCVHTTNQ